MAVQNENADRKQNSKVIVSFLERYLATPLNGWLYRL